MKNNFLLIVILLLIFGCQSEESNNNPVITITASGLTDDILPLNATASFNASLSDYDGDVSELSYRWILIEENAQLSDGIIALGNPFTGSNFISCIGVLEGEEQIIVEAIDATNNIVASSSYSFMISGPNFVAGCFDQSKFLYNYNGVNNPYICNIDGTDAQSLPFNFEVTISPDGQWYGYVEPTFSGFEMRVQRCDGTEITSVPESYGIDYQPKFSLDSRTLYFQRPNPLQGDLINTSIAYSDIAAYDLETGEVNFLSSYYQIEESVSYLSVSPVTGNICLIKADPQLVGGFYEYIYTLAILNPETGVITDIYTFAQHNQPFRGLDWSPDGQTITFSGSLANGERGIFRINATAGSQPFLIFATPPDVTAPLRPTFHDGGTRIAFARALNGQDNRNIWSIDVNGNDLQQITDTQGNETLTGIYRY